MMSLSDIENETTDSNIINEVETENAALKKTVKAHLKKIRPVTYAQSNRRIK